MSDPVLNEEIARLEIEIDAVRDALDEAIKRNEALEEEAAMLRGQRDAAEAALAEVSEANVYWGYWGEQVNVLDREIERLKAALASSEQKP